MISFFFFKKYDFMYMLIISDGENNDKRIHLRGIIVRDGYAIKLINHNYFTGQKSFSMKKNFHKLFFSLLWATQRQFRKIENIYDKKKEKIIARASNELRKKNMKIAWEFMRISIIMAESFFQSFKSEIFLSCLSMQCWLNYNLL